MAQTPPPGIDPVPTPPIQRGDRATFSSRVDAFILWLVNAVTQFRAVATNVYNNAVDAFQSAQAAQEAAAGVVLGAAEQAEAARISAASAADSANAAAAINSAVPWVSGATYAQFVATISRINFKTYRKITTSSGGTTDPANDPTNWLLMGSLALPRRARSANVKLIASDISALIDITSGTFTQTFDTAANLGAGWFCYIRNAGTGDITIPDSDGIQNWIMYPKETRLFSSDGVTLRSVVIVPFYKEFTTTGNFIKPPGYSMFGGEMWHGGSAGTAGQPSNSAGATGPAGGGGAGGGANDYQLPASKISNTTLVSVGAGGTPEAAAGASSFGSLVSTINSQGTYWRGGTGGAAGSGSFPSYAGASAPMGGAGGGGGYGGIGSGQTSPPALGGAGILGGNGGAGGANGAPGQNGATPGGGGGGGSGGTGVYNSGTGLWSIVAGKVGGDGARGEVRIWGIA